MKKIKFSIRYKILAVVTILLVSAIGFYLALAMQIFKQDKTELVFDLNKSFVTTLSAEFESTLRGASDKLKLYALTNDRSVFEEILTHDLLLTRIEIHERGLDGNYELKSKVTNQEYLKLYALDEQYFKKQIPFDEIQSRSIFVWNAGSSGKPPLIGLGISVIKEGVLRKPSKILSVVGYVKADLFLKNLKSSSLTKAYLVDAKGNPLLQLNENLINHPLVKELARQNISSGVLEFKQNEKSYLGAYSKTGFAQVSVISEVESDKAFMAMAHLIRRSFIFALIICTITFIATIFFSRSLIHPLQRLVSAMEKVAEGHLDSSLKEVRTNDEIFVLAESFNKMTMDLKTSRDQLEEINRELENKVIDRTKKLEEQNRAVKEAQEALLRTTRLASVGEIAGRAAHEVLNPLTSIMTRIQKVQKRLAMEIANDKNLLGDIVKAWRDDFDQKGLEGFIKSLKEPSQIDPKQTLLQEDLTNISEVFSRWDKDIESLDKDTQFLLQQSQRIEKILGGMRSLSHVTGQKVHQRAHEVIHDAVNIVADLFDKHRIKISENYSAHTDDVLIDRDEIIQVLTNILKNSLQAVTEAKNKNSFVSINTKNENDKFIIDIIDNGQGIEAKNQAKLFESNFSTKSPEVGTGLGLSISRRFIRACHGDLFLVKSTPGVETVFRIELPIYKKMEKAA
ncbi:MAG: HAMP domain-containing protein [Oligoflexia bacterium]|nr:HAMP domain-containing protein [Oligoflexia bacterium]